jgi:hypothetical protein
MRAIQSRSLDGYDMPPTGRSGACASFGYNVNFLINHKTDGSLMPWID